eukprot:TRINITY_DN47402_c0_g1_i1.p1 TRINITY_DN47402_c0_g1~~TRINITY_DN47402_c0_g1_i1.p1  ORF type:complete len:801 (+),score=198.71 TRINITY_DN47402_c0_g1_i1:145-2547(+)
MPVVIPRKDSDSEDSPRQSSDPKIKVPSKGPGERKSPRANGSKSSPGDVAGNSSKEVPPAFVDQGQQAAMMTFLTHMDRKLEAICLRLGLQVSSNGAVTVTPLSAMAAAGSVHVRGHPLARHQSFQRLQSVSKERALMDANVYAPESQQMVKLLTIQASKEAALRSTQLEKEDCQVLATPDNGDDACSTNGRPKVPSTGRIISMNSGAPHVPRTRKFKAMSSVYEDEDAESTKSAPWPPRPMLLDKALAQIWKDEQEQRTFQQDLQKMHEEKSKQHAQEKVTESRTLQPQEIEKEKTDEEKNERQDSLTSGRFINRLRKSTTGLSQSSAKMTGTITPASVFSGTLDRDTSKATTDWRKQVSRRDESYNELARRLSQVSKVSYGSSNKSEESAGSITDLAATLFGKRGTTNRSSTSTFIWSVLEDSESSIIAHYYAKLMPVLLALSVVITLMQCIANSPIDENVLSIMENFLSIVFAGEMLLRFYVWPNRWQFLQDGFNIIDFVAAWPIALRIAIGFRVPDEDVLDPTNTMIRAILLGINPMLRLLKMLRYMENWNLITAATNEIAEAMPTMLFLLVIQTWFFASLIYFVEPRDNIESLPHAMWLTIVTMTTVGYGDVTPQSPVGSCVVAVLVVFSVMYMAMPLGIIGDAVTNVWNDRDRILLMRRTRDRLAQWGYCANDIPQLFKHFDRNQSGELNLTAFRELMHSMQMGLKDSRVVQLFETMDADGGGSIDDEEFIKHLFPSVYHEMYGQKREEEEAEEAEREREACEALEAEQDALDELDSLEDISTIVKTRTQTQKD